MAIADIQKKIEQSAAAEAAKLLDEARSQADVLNADADAEVSKSKAYYDGLYAAEAPEVAKRARIIASLDVKKIQLGARQELIADAYSEALKILCAMPEASYLAFAEKLLDQAVSSGDEELLVSAGEKYITQAFVDKYNAARGKKLTLSGEKIDIDGGFVVRSGKVSVNCSFAKLVDWLKEELQSEVVAHLFGADDLDKHLFDVK